MKYSLLSVPLLLPCAAFAQAGGLFSTKVFSRQSIKNWREAIYSNEKVQRYYAEEIAEAQAKLDGADGYVKICPKNIAQADIQFAEAIGTYAKLVPSTDRGSINGKDWKDQMTKSTEDINDVLFTYNVNGGLCGTVTISTYFNEKAGMFNVGRWEWSAPHYSELHAYNIKQLDTHSDAPLQSISSDEMMISSGEALKYAMNKFPNLKANGFGTLELRKHWRDKQWNVEYWFKGLKGHGDSPDTIAVGVGDDGNKYYVILDPKDDDFWADVVEYWQKQYGETYIAFLDRITVMTKWRKIPEPTMWSEFANIPSRPDSESSMEEEIPIPWDSKNRKPTIKPTVNKIVEAWRKRKAMEAKEAMEAWRKEAAENRKNAF